jgi:hypothetical protein
MDFSSRSTIPAFRRHITLLTPRIRFLVCYKIWNCSLYEYIFVSAVDIATVYGLDDWGDGVRVPVGSSIFSFLCRPDLLWGQPSLLSKGHRGSFPGGKAAGAWKLTTHLQLVSRTRKCGSIHPPPNTPSWRSVSEAQGQLYFLLYFYPYHILSFGLYR